MTLSLALLMTLGLSIEIHDSTNSQAATSQVVDTETARIHDWPSFLGPLRNSRSAETGILTDWSAGKLKILWQRELGKGYSLGSTSRGRYFQLDAIGDECRLRCLNERTGQAIWEFRYQFEYQDLYNFDDGPRTTPVIDENRVYIFGVEGMLHCLDWEDGKVIWSVDTQRKFGVVQNFFGVGSTPAVHGEHLIVMIGGSPEEDQQLPPNSLDRVSSNGTAIVVFNKHTGDVLHQFGDDLASYSSIQLYRDADKMYGLGWLRNNLMGFDFETGRTLWSFPYRARKYESVNAMTPVVQGTQLFLSESYGPGAILLDLSQGEPQVVWRDSNVRQRSLATHWNTPVLHEGKLYGCHGENRNGAELRCVDWDTGQVHWKERGFARSSVTWIDGHLVVLDENGRLALVKASADSFQLVTEYTDPSSGRLPIRYPCWAAPVISNGRLFVRGKEKLVCLQLVATD